MRRELRYFALGYIIGGVTLLLCMLITLVVHADDFRPPVHHSGWSVIPAQGHEKELTSEEIDRRVAAMEPKDNDKVLYKIAIIDTGFDPARANIATNLCKTGHYDFFTRTANVNWYHPHGTQVVDVASDRLKDVDYCLIIFQVYTSTDIDGPHTDAGDVAQAINDAIGLGISAINISMSGSKYSAVEEEALKNAEKAHIPVFISAGNKSKHLDKGCDTYPACYENTNILVVGMQDPEEPKKHAPSSNFGPKVRLWARGDYHMGEESEWASGTSFAAPRALAEYILFLEHKRLQGAHKHK